MKNVIVISAKAQHGKDTTADYLIEKLQSQGYKVVKTHFAKYMKQILKDFYGWNGEKDEYWRAMLQYIGTDLIRKKLNKPLFHVKRTCEDIEIIANDFDFIIIPDCRFRNEVLYTQACFPNQVIDVRIKRLNFESQLTDEQKQHPSEIDLDNFNFNYYLQASNLKELEKEIDDKLGFLYKDVKHE